MQKMPMKPDELMASMTEEQMLALWKSVLHLEDVRRDCSVERDDGIDIDSLLLTRIRQWYHHLLATAPLAWVPIDDVKDETAVVADATGVVTMQLPQRAVRPVEVRLGGWECAVADFHEPDGRVSKLQQSSWTRGGCASPVAVDYGGGELRLYSLQPGSDPVVEAARCVAWAADGSYRLAHAALDTIPQWADSL